MKINLVISIVIALFSSYILAVESSTQNHDESEFSVQEEQVVDGAIEKAEEVIDEDEDEVVIEEVEIEE